MLEPKENPVEVAGLGADTAEEAEPNEKLSLGAVLVTGFEFEASAMLANGFGLDGGSSPTTFFDASGVVDIAVGCARVVEAKGLEEAAGLEAGMVGADGASDPLPLPNFRLDTLTIFRRCITS